MFGITFHDQLYGSWDQAKGYLVEELQSLHSVLDRRVGSFLANTEAGAIVIGSPSGSEWIALPIGAADTVLRSDGSAPSWQKVVLSTDVTGVLGVTHGGTGLSAVTTGDLFYGSAANVISRLAIGTVGKVLRTNGTLPVYSTFTIPDTFAQGDLIYGSASNVLSALAKDTNATRYLSNTGTSNNPAWAQVNLANGVTGDLPYANLTPASAGSLLLGRGDAGAGDWQEISLGTGLSMSGTTLNASSPTVDHVVMSDGANPPSPVDDGNGNFIYIEYTP